MKPLRGGDFRHVVTVQKPVAGNPDSYGKPVITWTTVAFGPTGHTFTSIRAALWPLTGKEYLAAQEIASKIDLKIRIRYQPGILPSWRIIWGSRTFEIAAILQKDMRPIFLDLLCYEIKTGATKTAPKMSAPTISAISPATGANTASKSVTITGTGFSSGTTITITKTGQTTITGTSVVIVSDTSITCSLPITGAAAGAWSVVVTGVDYQTATLSSGFTVTS